MMKTGASPPDAADKLLDLLQRQRAALLRQDPAAIAELEAGTAHSRKPSRTFGGKAPPA
jgi:hypothetical protein